MAFLYCVFGLGSLVVLSTHANAQTQNLRNKSIVYQAVDGEVKGYIYIASSGTIFWSATGNSMGLGAKDKGIRFKLGGALKENHSGCQVNSTSSLSGNVLALNSAVSCPSLPTSDSHSITVTISGDECSLTQSSRFNSPQTGNVSSTSRSTTCRVVSGNKIAE